ncbi:hypothetical protein BDA99DRAFT_563282 [Phascolomyces articulosus]|uniref:Uncharacterized protein n=1 Tax=Phascolomyces articulosus TaxID=60185 RepID=A0AAD5PAS2_9FUNG|nr:hypothetical protein BDA99DRAFT_563282 [Phascolomyces articulosus]
MEFFLQRLKAFEQNPSDGDVLNMFMDSKLIMRPTAEKCFKDAVREVGLLNQSKIQKWCQNQVFQDFPALKTTTINNHWVTMSKQEVVSSEIHSYIKMRKRASDDINHELDNYDPTTQQTPLPMPVQQPASLSPKPAQQTTQSTLPTKLGQPTRHQKSPKQQPKQLPEHNNVVLNEEYQQDDEYLRSDMTADYHSGRTSSYHIGIALGSELVESKYLDNLPAWIIDHVNVSAALDLFRMSCFQIEPKKLSDMRLLALNQVFLFVPNDMQKSVTKYINVFTDDGNGEQVRNEVEEEDLRTRGLLVLKKINNYHTYKRNVEQVTERSILWCNTIAQLDRINWMDIQKSTVPILLEAVRNENEIDVIIANLLHSQSLKYAGNKISTTLEDGYVHQSVASLFETVFQSDCLFGYDWANGGLQHGKRKRAIFEDQTEPTPPKPDFIAIVSSHHTLAVGEIKPPSNSNSTNKGESDVVKLGKMMRSMVNDLILFGVKAPMVGGVLVKGKRMSTYIMKLDYPSIYEFIELSDSPLFQDIASLSLLPRLVQDLVNLKGILKSTAMKIMSRSVEIGTAQGSDEYFPPLSYIFNHTYTLVRDKKDKKEKTAKRSPLKEAQVEKNTNVT